MPCLRPEPARRYTLTKPKGELRPLAPNIALNIVLTRLGCATVKHMKEKELHQYWLRFCESRVTWPSPDAPESEPISARVVRESPTGWMKA
jgi:hypothetical protein